MMRNWIVAGVAVAAVGATGVLAQATAEPPLLPGQVTFLRLPPAEARTEYFPAKAFAQRIEGRATVVCRIAETGRLEDCAAKVEDPPGLGFGEAVVKLAEAEIRLGKSARDGKPTAGRSFQFARIFPLRGGAGTKTVQPLDRGVVDEDGLRRRWIRPPDARAVDSCFRHAMAKSEDVQLTLKCRSAPDDRLADCRATKNSRAPDVRYEAAGVCAIETARFRVEDPAGAPVTGAEVVLPFSRRK